MDQTWVVYKNHVCVMIWDQQKKKRVYIPERRFLKMMREGKIQ